MEVDRWLKGLRLLRFSEPGKQPKKPSFRKGLHGTWPRFRIQCASMKWCLQPLKKYAVFAGRAFNSEFDIAVRAPKDGELETVYQPFLNDLLSRDFLARSFAASAISQNPPTFTESAMLAMADDRMLANASIHGLKRLATPAARAKLVQMSDTSSPEYFRQPAITALGEIGNPDDCEVMLKIANENKNYTQALAYAAAGRICKEKAIPVLLNLVSSTGSQLLAGILHGLGNSTSRSAVAVLINILQSGDQNIRREASTALETLTHKESRYGVMGEDSAKQAYDEWTGWWSTNRSSAVIYSSDQCVAPQTLR